MKPFKLAYSEKACSLLNPISEREIVDVRCTDFVDVAAVVVAVEDAQVLRDKPFIKALELPVFVVTSEGESIPDDMMKYAYGVFDLDPLNRDMYDTQIECAATRYEKKVVPPFARALMEYVKVGYFSFDTPGHEGGQYFLKHPAGYALYNFFGENLFKADISCGVPELGDLMIHEGVAVDAEKHAAHVFNADKTYFIMNGTSSANKVVLNSVLAPGDIVLYDRNNHKSVSHGALIEAGATPVYLETARNPFGSIGGIISHCFTEEHIRKIIAERDPVKAQEKRPVRLAVIQLGTYDGCIYSARQVIDKIGHLCDYILFDSAWVGYEQFIPMMKDCSPLLLELGPEDPGIFVTQSVHKQLLGFSMTSQVHKKDSHIKGQDRYVPHKRVNNCYMMHTSTSPFYPLFAALDVNARVQEGEAGKLLWANAMKVAVEARKSILKNCHYLRPLVPPMVHGKKWEEGDTDKMINDMAYWTFEPGAKWHGFEGYSEGQYFVDPCKIQFVTGGIDIETGEYEDFGIPANVLMTYLRANQIIPEKCDLNDILFLVTPADTKAKMDDLIAKLIRFEQLIDEDRPMSEVLPAVYYANEQKYRGYTMRRLCREMHEFYKNRKVNVLQRRMFLRNYLPAYAMLPQDANYEFIRGHGELVRLSEITGRIALEGALPYPPGVLCVQPGERWSETVTQYFLALEEGINQLPGFTPEIQGVYFQDEADGSRRAYGYVLKKEYEK